MPRTAVALGRAWEVHEGAVGPEAGATAAGEPGEPSAMRLLGCIGHVGHCPMVSCPGICWNLAKKTAIYTLCLRDAKDSFLPRCCFFFSKPPSSPIHRSPPCASDFQKLTAGEERERVTFPTTELTPGSTPFSSKSQHGSVMTALGCWVSLGKGVPGPPGDGAQSGQFYG